MSKNDSTNDSSLKACDHDIYLNQYILLKISATIQVTSWECKRSGSVLKYLHTYLIASMRQTRLKALALLHINYDVNIDIDNVVDIFAKKKKKALEFLNICNINSY